MVWGQTEPDKTQDSSLQLQCPHPHISCHSHLSAKPVSKIFVLGSGPAPNPYMMLHNLLLNTCIFICPLLWVGFGWRDLLCHLFTLSSQAKASKDHAHCIFGIALSLGAFVPLSTIPVLENYVCVYICMYSFLKMLYVLGIRNPCKK